MTAIHMTPFLQQFHITLQQWIDEGFPANPVFDAHHGMCMNLRRFAKLYGKNQWNAIHELEWCFHAEGLDRLLPFNPGPRTTYYREQDIGALWLNPARLAWVKSWAANSKAWQADSRLSAQGGPFR